MLQRWIGSVPRAALALGLLGAVPFVALAAASLLPGDLALQARGLLRLYAAVILSFMGGVHWGLAMAASEPSFRRLGASVLPALVGWLALPLDDTASLLVLATAFLALLWHDLRETAASRAPAWYPHLRQPLTLIVVASLLLAMLSPG